MRYQSFRLQVWQSDRFGQAQWSARLEGLQDGRHQRFHSADALLAYLGARLDTDIQDAEHTENELSWFHDQGERKTDDD
jgi:hypothetical protein